MERIKNITECSNAEMSRVVDEIKFANREMNFFDRDVHPYGYAVKVSKMVADASDFSRCSESSKLVLYTEIKGLVDIINVWIDEYNSEKVKVRILVGDSMGKVIEISDDFAEKLINIGYVEICE